MLKHQYNVDLIESYFNIVKVGVSGVYILLIFAQSIRCRLSLGGYKVYPRSMF